MFLPNPLTAESTAKDAGSATGASGREAGACFHLAALSLWIPTTLLLPLILAMTLAGGLILTARQFTQAVKSARELQPRVSPIVRRSALAHLPRQGRAVQARPGWIRGQFDQATSELDIRKLAAVGRHALALLYRDREAVPITPNRNTRPSASDRSR